MIELQIQGMDCSECARTIEKGVARLDGVTACTLDFTSAKLRVQGDIERANIVARVRELGYDAPDADSATTAATALPAAPGATGVIGFVRYLLQRRTTALALLGALLVLPGLITNELLPMLGWSHPLWDVTSVLAMVVAGFPVARSAWRSLRINREISINLLMTIAAVGAVVIGAYTEAGLVMVLFAIGEALEGYTVDRARNAIDSLMRIAPSEATVLRACMDCQGHMGQDGYSGGPCPFCGVEEQRIPVEAVQVGDLMLVKPGERIAMDGRIRSGASAVNQAPVTGESMPVEKLVEGVVYAGSINGEGALEVEVTQLAADNTISRMTRLVMEAQERRAPVQRFVDQFARIYTPAVVAGATLVAVVPPLFFGAPFWNPDGETQGWLYRALALLVVACPCALVISTPVSLISAIANAARNGVLVKGGAALEALSRVRAFAFDKTGTLTAGAPRVTGVRTLQCTPEEMGCAYCDDLLAWASAVERRSEHPLALAVLAEATDRGLRERYPAAQDVTTLVGRGVRGAINGNHVLIGSHHYFDEAVTHPSEQCGEIQRAADHGYTPMLVSVDEQYLGYITVADEIRPSAPAALAALHRAGISTMIMLTGDNAATAQRVAGAVGITDVRAQLLPADKLNAIETLRDQYHHIAMVGDGINDAPALAAATVGIAMGAGTAQAMETADVALLGNDLSKLAFIYRLSRAAITNIRQNVTVALGIKALFQYAVLAGVGSMWLAVLADVGAALLVTLNALRLLRYR